MLFTITKRNGDTVEFESTLSLAKSAEVVKADLCARQVAGGFASDLLQAWEDGRSTKNQQLWLMKLAADLAKPQEPGFFQQLVAKLQQMQEGRKGQVALRFRGVTVKACTRGGNVGGLYVFTGGDQYAGKILPTGKPVGAFTSNVQAMDVLAEAMADPEGTARAFGREFGICSCCGRGLEDPVSVFGGIGPVCLERLAGKAARKQLEAAFKASQTIQI
ncbi:MAG: DUF6011 domain-containing protein [Synechococcus sp.]